MLSAKVYLIIITQVWMVNGKQTDSIKTEYISSSQSYSECSKEIQDRKNRFNKERQRKSKKYSYTYKSIQCKSKTIKLDKKNIVKEVFSINW